MDPWSSSKWLCIMLWCTLIGPKVLFISQCQGSVQRGPNICQSSWAGCQSWIIIPSSSAAPHTHCELCGQKLPMWGQRCRCLLENRQEFGILSGLTSFLCVDPTKYLRDSRFMHVVWIFCFRMKQQSMTLSLQNRALLTTAEGYVVSRTWIPF